MSDDRYAELLRDLADAPDGLCLAGPQYAAAEAAQIAGLVTIVPAKDVDIVVLTDAGRRFLGLKPNPKRVLSRLLRWLSERLAL